MSGVVSFFNHPEVKQNIKFGIGAATALLGAEALYYLSRGKVYSKYFRQDPQAPDTFMTRVNNVWNRTTLACAQVSMILSAAVTPIGVWAISTAVNKFFTSAQVDSVFGPNTTFEGNWKHPRHVVSLVALGLAVPAVLSRIFVTPKTGKERTVSNWVIITTLTSRPVLHHLYALAERIARG